MHIDNTFLYPAIPVLILLAAAELLYMLKECRHDHYDMFATIGLTLGSLPVAVLIKGGVLYIYTFIYHFRIFTIPWNTGWGWLTLFFCDELAYYWYHRISHQVRFLWASHKVHHSSAKFTFLSGLRVPWTGNITGTFLFWGWMPLIGIDPLMVIFMKSASALYQFWLHTELIGKLPRWVEAVFNTPSHHRVHHSSNIEYLDKNHGGILIIWDRLFGTFQPEIAKPKYGLTENIKSYNPAVIALHEWFLITKDLKKAKKIKQKFGYFFNPPGWSHDGSKKTTRQLQTQLNKIP